MRRTSLPAVDQAVSRRLSLKKFPRRDNTDAITRRLRAISSAEVQKWARLLIAQYGHDAEDLAETGIIEMLAVKNGAALVAWARIFAAIQEIRSQMPGCDER